MKKERILYIDRLRGINILLVVMGHVITRNVIDGDSTGILQWGSTFRMPLFMFLCGYIAGKIIKPKIFEDYPRFVLRKARTMLLPFFAWPLLVDTFFFQKELHLDFGNTLLDLVNGGGLWFLWYLFWVTLLYSLWLFLSHKLNPSNKILLDLLFFGIILSGLVGLLQWGVVVFMKQFISFYLFYFFGVFVAKYAYLAKILMNSLAFSLAFLVFVVLVGHYSYGISSTENTVIRLFCAFTGIAVFYYLIRHMDFHPFIDKYIRLWGVNSLVIYVTHFYVVKILSVPFIPNDFNQIPLFVVTGILTLLTAMVSMFIYKILIMSEVFKFLLYGEKFNYAQKHT